MTIIFNQELNAELFYVVVCLLAIFSGSILIGRLFIKAIKIKNKFKKVTLYDEFFIDINMDRGIQYEVPTFTIESNHYDIDDNHIGYLKYELLSLDDMLKHVDLLINNYFGRRV